MKPQQHPDGEWSCEHGTALDVHCCNCHSGFLFDADSCVCEVDMTDPKAAVPGGSPPPLDTWRIVPNPMRADGAFIVRDWREGEGEAYAGQMPPALIRHQLAYYDAEKILAELTKLRDLVSQSATQLSAAQETIARYERDRQELDRAYDEKHAKLKAAEARAEQLAASVQTLLAEKEQQVQTALREREEAGHRADNAETMYHHATNARTSAESALAAVRQQLEQEKAK